MTDPEIQDWPAITVAGVQVRAQPGVTDFGAVWGLLAERGVDRLPRIRSDRAYGVASDFDREAQRFNYLAGYQVDPGAALPDGFDTAVVPATTYAAFWTTLPGLMETIRHANEVWLPASGYRRAEGPEFELYDERFDPSQPDSPMAFVIPIVRR